MRSRQGGEEGFALLIVMVLMGVMLTAGFAIASTTDTQTSASQAQRVRDASFNLAESALNAQIFALSRDWPGKGRSSQQYPVCAPTTGTTRCPDNAALLAGASTDLAGGTWQTTVRDNGGSGGDNFYSDATTAGQFGYDVNDDGTVWVRSQGISQGRRRTLVALVRSEKQEEDIPHAALIAGRLNLQNNGNKGLIEANGGLVAVRCTPVPNEANPCLGHSYGSGKYKTQADLLAFLATQISGTTPVSAYQGGVAAPAMTPEARQRMKNTAIADGTYYAGCPTAAQMTGRVVYIENATNCSYNGNSSFNAKDNPGILVVNAGSVAFGGGAVFYGVIYAVNSTNLTSQVIETQGNSHIEGGVLIDGDAQVLIGASGLNLKYDVNAFRAVTSYGAAGVVQNTFREIQAG